MGIKRVEAEVSGSEGLDMEDCLDMLEETDEDRQFLNENVSLDDDQDDLPPNPHLTPPYLPPEKPAQDSPSLFQIVNDSNIFKTPPVSTT